MRTRIVKLEVRNDAVTGELGLCLCDLPHFDEYATVDAGGIQIAHDLIEHQNGPQNIGSIEDELQALGAIWYVRGQFGELNRDGRGNMYTVHQNIGADIGRQARECDIEALSGFIPKTRAGDHDDDLWEILAEGRKWFLQELEHNDDDPEEREYDAREYFKRVLPWMRVGLRKARRKYPRAADANTLFWNIQRAVQAAGRGVEYEGQVFELRYNLYGASCHEIYEEDES